MDRALRLLQAISRQRQDTAPSVGEVAQMKHIYQKSYPYDPLQNRRLQHAWLMQQQAHTGRRLSGSSTSFTESRNQPTSSSITPPNCYAANQVTGQTDSP